MSGVVFAILLSIIFIAAPSSQGTKGRSAIQVDPCAKAMTQSDLNLCEGQQYKKADARLNAIYRKLVGLIETDLARDKQQKYADIVKFDETALVDLKKTEHLWIQYRDSQCDAAEQQIDGGSMAPMTWAICMTNVTEDRINELKDAYANPDRTLE